ncbi:hypothetical protein KKI23_03135 [Patescibacteria group bacterium]|nr:hypothetical protein [Patescibacteria group bacterium]
MKAWIMWAIASVIQIASMVGLFILYLQSCFPQPFTALLVVMAVVSTEYHLRYMSDCETKLTPEQLRNLQKLMEAEEDCLWGVK